MPTRSIARAFKTAGFAKIAKKARINVKALCEAIQQVIREFIQANSMTLDDLDHIVLHQANQRIIAHIAKTSKQPLDKFVTVIEDYGNTSAASIPIALDTLKKQHKIHPGDKILMIGFGGGLTYGAFALTV